MSDTQSQTYAPGQHPDLPPPVGVAGPLHWIKQNLFSNWTSAILTVLTIYLLYLIIPPLLDWGVFHSVVDATGRRQCQMTDTGACWAFVKDRFLVLVYGFYPAPERWRVDVAFVLLFPALVPVLFDRVPHRKWGLWFSAIYPFIAGWLLLGGLGLKPIDTRDFGGAMLNTVIGVTGIACSLPIGILLALGRQSHLPVVRTLSVLFIEFIRGVPLITLLFVASTMLNYFLPPGTTFNLILRVLIMVSLFASAYIAEMIRGGLQAIPKGQFEAADAMGLKYWQSMRLIILPQALKISIPGIVNTFIGLFKDTTLVIIIGLLDMLGMGRSALSDANWQGLSNEMYISIAVFFFVACFAMSRYSIWLEKRLDTGYGQKR